MSTGSVTVMAEPRAQDIAARFHLRSDSAGDWASFVPLIGGWSDERLSIGSGAHEDGEVLVATARPVDTAEDHRPVGPGVFALRWFECAPHDAEELVHLSESAWPAFEEGTPGTRIFGLFRVGTSDAVVARFLLCTRYPNVAGWESSRADTDSAEFRRRRELITRSQVSLWRLDSDHG
jgi:hypothetical protein